ncbi:hypothetical protein TGGT1_212770 [Toxoplasma gondii GT1]|uniref:Uncharacterized protein n=5 Tax=Toxoplasma gondii TaxID=5811 RepID=S7W3R1_TOXGG|nr:hypothetical protein TGGT1_212770 [Toxoplasma gondii GT1]KAF4643659.1 hypothetical protein TGRH88_024130 [Toxoplasma gondii]KFG54993.1 hypothetical protein TGFOU_212770 [Toxoplasma gondii FOU]PUA86286.1 hypothetical protein TGBR9_212770 [Toxoplasma gondii TgCATBr9]RQX69573.1 hypothetical protein TGCAST_212770 [Toxoplasma gondii CAST]
MAGPLALQPRQGDLGCRYESSDASQGFSGSVAWSRNTSGDLQCGTIPGMGRVAPVLSRRVVLQSEVDGNKGTTKQAGAVPAKRGYVAPNPPPALRNRAKEEPFSHEDAVQACKGSNLFFSNIGHGKWGIQSRGNVTQICTFEGTLEDYFQMRSTDGSSGGEGSSCSASERGFSDDKASTGGNSFDGATHDRRTSDASRQFSHTGSNANTQLDAALAGNAGIEADDERQPSGHSTRSSLVPTERERSDASRGPLVEALGGVDQTGADKDEKSAPGRDQSAAKEQNEGTTQGGEKRGRLITLEMKDGCVVWPKDRPVIPLPHWQLTNFSQEPLDAQQWVQLPTVGGLSPYAELLEGHMASAVAATDIRQAHAPGTTNRYWGSSTPMPQPVQTTLPRIKLPVGCEAPPLSVQIGTMPFLTPASDQASNSTSRQASRQASGTVGRHLGSTKSVGGPLFPALGGQACQGAPGAMYTNFSNKRFIQHKPTGAEGEVLRSEDNGASLIVRLKNGRIKKFDSTQCRVTKAVCTPTRTPSDKQLTAAAHHHALAMMMNRAAHAAAGRPGVAPALQFGVANRSSDRGLAAGHSATVEQPNVHASSVNPRKLSIDTLSLIGSASKSLFGLLSIGRKEAPSASATGENGSQATSGLRLSINPAMRGADQVPRVEDLVKFAQEQASTSTDNTLVVGGPTSHPSIRAVGSRVAVEAVRTKRYSLDDGEEGNMVPVFSPECQALQSQEAEEARWLQDMQQAAPESPDEILMERHRALEKLRQMQMAAQEEEIIYAQDAPEATLAPGIVAPTIIKDSLVVVPKEHDDVRQLIRAPGIVHPIVDVPKLEIIHPARNAHPATVPQFSTSACTPDDDTGAEWYASLQQQVKNQLLHYYAQTGNLQAATAAVTGSGIHAPEIYTSNMLPYFGDMGASAVQRRQATVLRDEADQIEFVPMA